MNINLHARKIDIKVRAAIMAMGEFAMSRLVPSTRLRNNITLNIHLKHHVEDGEAMLSEFTNPNKPREFKIIIDPYRVEVDKFGRTLTDTEWAHSILKLLAHELVHVKQYVMGELKPANNGFVYKKTLYSPESLDEYFEQPFEIEAYGRERGLMNAFLLRWKDIEKELGIEY
tara:strand:+ start:242 stop:757 length:516 start_codon:yes stop_codon:yes gene_type:complete